MTTTRAQSKVRQAVPFFGVRDIDESIRFYVDGLGCRMTNYWVDGGKLRWCWLELGGAALMLQEFWKEGTRRNIPEGQVGLGIAINFICSDAVALYQELLGRGIKAKRPFVGNRMWVTEVIDPDGYRLLFESPTDAPEESV